MNQKSSATKSVGVVGLGYVGLPVAQHATRAGFSVTGFDISEPTVESLNSGSSHIDDISDTEMQEMLDNGFLATHIQENFSQLNVYVICVPTPLIDGTRPDVSAIESAGRIVAQGLSKGSLVILESTSYPGTTEKVLLPILEENGLRAGTDFSLCFSPERIDPGNSDFTFANTPKIVGGFTDNCRDRGVEFYATMVDKVVPTRGLQEAEMAKLLENTYRHVNIALVNEMARFSADLGIDFWDVIDAAATKPFGFQAFYPGPGVGGHCIPIDPNYLSHYVRSETGYAFRFVELAQDINQSMPAYVANRVQELLNKDFLSVKGSQVLILGVTYKKDVSDLRESPAIPVARALLRMGANLVFHDPYIQDWEIDGKPIPRVSDPLLTAKNADCCVLLQNHSAYNPEELTLAAARLLDTRGITRNSQTERL